MLVCPASSGRRLRRSGPIALRDILSVSRAAAITGPRQAGKSTLARQLQLAGVMPNYFTLDDEATRTAALADPEDSRSRSPGRP
jgi:predicted AAA+ superfamily ATPase